MGLDCFVRACPAGTDTATTEGTELWYGRKTNEIHGWMEQQWLELHPGQTGGNFNCGDLPLTPDLLDQLEDACMNKQLVHTPGFFYGGACDEDEIADDVQKILITARQALKDGMQVFYTSWW